MNASRRDVLRSLDWESAARSSSETAYQDVLKKRLGYARSAPLRPGITVNRGDLVFFDGMKHVALATGRTVDGPGDMVKHEVISLWIPPLRSAGHLNSKTQRTTIEDIKNSVQANLPEPIKEITVGSNPW